MNGVKWVSRKAPSRDTHSFAQASLFSADGARRSRLDFECVWLRPAL